MPIRTTQNSFTGGELTPSLHARPDLSAYIRGLATCKNFFVHAHGGAYNRPGLEFICACKEYEVPTSEPGEISPPIPFFAALGDAQAGVDKDYRVQMFDIVGDWSGTDTPPQSQQPGGLAEVFSLNFNHDGSLLVATHRREGGITGWDTTTWLKEDIPVTDADGTPPQSSHPVYGVFKPDGTEFAISYINAATPSGWWYEVYEVVPGGTWTKKSITTRFQGAAVSWQTGYSPDGNYIAVPSQSGNPEFFVFRTSDYKTKETLQGQPDFSGTNPAQGCWGAGFSPDGSYVAFTSLQPPYIYVYDVVPGGTWTLVSTGMALSGQGFRLAWSPDGKYLAVGELDSPYLRVFNVGTWTAVSITTPADSIDDVCWSSDSEWLLASKSSGSIPHAYAYEVNNGWALSTSTDLTQTAIAWLGCAMP